MPIYRVTFQPMEQVIEVDPQDFPYGDHGDPGSLLDIALANGISIEHACGGVGVCATCHVIIDAGADHLSAATEEELDVVELAPGNTPNSRLACKAVVQGDVTVRIPGWNRNAVRENGP